MTHSTDSPLEQPPLSLYVHIPWCVKKCPYCDFNSHETNHHRDNLPEQQYITALKHDLEQDIHWINDRELSSIFFGGGTPSLFSAKAIGDILQLIEKNIRFAKNIEITLEANPGTFEQEKFSGFYAAGINRLSIGIQSFEEKHLEKLGRIHNRQEAIQAIKIARKAGFNNINLDLMHGLPEQTPENALSDLQIAINLAPEHLSWYQLTIEPNTIFYRQPPPLPADDILADIQHAGSNLLAENHYQQYEVSAFSRAEKQSRHNTNYWQFGDYIGIGAGAHGKFTDTRSQQVVRRQKTRLPNHYMDSAKKYKEAVVDRDELPLEFLMNALRLVNGAPIDYFEARTGIALVTIRPVIDKLVKQGLLDISDKTMKTTPLGYQFLNSVLSQLIDS